MSDTRDVALERIRTDGGTQMRARIDEFTVEDYRESYRDGVLFPPLDVFFDGEEYYLADGFHRLNAALLEGFEKLACTVHEGTLRDAILFAVGVNQSHGLRRSRADRRCCVMKLLMDEEWGARSNLWIAEQCGVSDKTVAEFRKQSGSEFRTEEKRVGKNGVAQAATKKRKKRKSRQILHVPPIDDDQPGRMDVPAAAPAITNNVVACPNCSGNEFDGDGDCTACLHPCSGTVEGKPSMPEHGTYKVFLGRDSDNFSALSAVFGLWGVVTDELRDWPPSMRKTAAATLRDIANQITEAGAA